MQLNLAYESEFFVDLTQVTNWLFGQLGGSLQVHHIINHIIANHVIMREHTEYLIISTMMDNSQ